MKSVMPLCVVLVLVVASLSKAADKPNFVWLISEDNSSHYLKLFDEHGAETPQIASLARQGVIYEHAFSNAPVCSVARTTLITSCYAPRIGTQFHRRNVLVPLPDGLKMFPAYLREAGYYTTNNSKTDYNAVQGDDVWDESSKKATWRNRDQDQPFFHKQSFGISHEGQLHFSQQEFEKVKTETDPETVFVAPNHPDTKLFRYTYARYHDRIKQADREVGKVVDQLRNDGLLEDTFVFYFSDHGGVLPGSKGYAYESGLHIPLVVRIPANWQHLVDVKLNSRVAGFVSFVDFGPTLLQLAGISIPEQVDGRPFLGKGVSLADVNAQDEAFGYADRFDEKYDLVRTLRKGKYEYVRSYQPFNFDGLQNNYRYQMLAYQQWRELFQQGKLNSVQSQFFEPRDAEALYDVEADPYETRNLAGDPQYWEVLLDLRKRLSTKMKEQPDLSMYPESYLAEHAFDNPAAFGKSHRDEIAGLVDIADLALVPFAEAQTEIGKALASKKPWQRYWGLIVCSCHGKSAEPFFPVAKSMAAHDPELLVRVRAAEFLGLQKAADPAPTLEQALQESQSGIETNLVLNTLVLLRDGKQSYKFNLDPAWFRSKQTGLAELKRRLEYLLPD